jgi:hypothetical protein
MEASSRYPLPCSHPPDTCPFCGALPKGGGNWLALYGCGAKLFPKFRYTNEAREFYGIWTFVECEDIDGDD